MKCFTGRRHCQFDILKIKEIFFYYVLKLQEGNSCSRRLSCIYFLFLVGAEILIIIKRKHIHLLFKNMFFYILLYIGTVTSWGCYRILYKMYMGKNRYRICCCFLIAGSLFKKIFFHLRTCSSRFIHVTYMTRGCSSKNEGLVYFRTISPAANSKESFQPSRLYCYLLFLYFINYQPLKPRLKQTGFGQHIVKFQTSK